MSPDGKIAIVASRQIAFSPAMMKFPGFRIRTTLGALCLLLLLAGCFETTQEFTLNPDGSGKVIHESTFQEINFSGTGRNPEEAMKETIAKVIKESKGVEVWRDVSFKRLEDGRIYFKGTAYFKNLTQLSIANQSMLDFNWETTADGHGKLTLRQKKNEGSLGLSAGPKEPDPTSLSPAALTKKIKEDRTKFQQSKPMLAGFIGTMKHAVVFHLPGKVEEVSNFVQDSSGALALQFDGKKLLDAMETLINDDAWMKTNSDEFAGQKMPWVDAKVNELVFGSKGPVSATATGMGGAMFDYTAEVAAAKQEVGALQLQLGATAAGIAAPAQGESLKGIKVVGVRFVTAADDRRELQPFDTGVGYALSLLAELPGTVLTVNDTSGLDTAIADDGSDLLPESEFNRRFSFPKLSTDKTAVLLQAELKLPGAEVRGMKEITGHLDYSVTGGTKEVDLGFTEIATDAKGTEFGARIKMIPSEPKNETTQQLELTMEMNPTTLRVVYLVAHGTKTELKRTGYSGSNDSFTYTLESGTAIAREDRIVVEIYDHLQDFKTPFKLENITLLGTPVSGK